MSDFDRIIQDQMREALGAYPYLEHGTTSDGQSPIIAARKISAYLPISDELAHPERYPYVAPVLTRWQRLRAWRSDRAWSIRRGLATKLLGYDPDDRNDW